MLKDKEYPATHSMSTSWFFIDLDDNVAIMEFDDNGPVPDGITDYAPNDVFTNLMVSDKDDVRLLNLTSQQSDELLKKLKTYNQKDDIDFGLFVQIDTKQTDYFVGLLKPVQVKHPDFSVIVCLSASLGLFYAQFFYLSDRQMRELKKKKTILKYLDADLDSDYEFDETIGDYQYTHNYHHFPFFHFKQPYWTGRMMRRLYSPMHAMKSSQMPDEIAERGIRLPVHFDSCAELQIAQHVPFTSYGESKTENGELYYELPLESGEKGLVAENGFLYVWCGHTCHKCFGEEYDNSYDFSISQYTECPTLLIISGTYSNLEYNWREKWPLLWHAANVPIIHGYPYKGNSFLTNNEIAEEVKKKGYKHIFENCRGYLENEIKAVNPYAIILFEETKRTLASYYEVEDEFIKINGERYRYFMYEELENQYHLLKTYAEKPFKGHLKNRIKTQEEVSD